MRAISERTLGDEGGFFADPYSALFFLLDTIFTSISSFLSSLFSRLGIAFPVYSGWREENRDTGA